MARIVPARQLVLAALDRLGQATRGELAEATGLNAPLITNHVKNLRNAEEIYVVGLRQGKMRKWRIYGLTPKGHFAHANPGRRMPTSRQVLREDAQMRESYAEYHKKHIRRQEIMLPTWTLEMIEEDLSTRTVA